MYKLTVSRDALVKETGYRFHSLAAAQRMAWLLNQGMTCGWYAVEGE